MIFNLWGNDPLAYDKKSSNNYLTFFYLSLKLITKFIWKEFQSIPFRITNFICFRL